MFRAGWQTDKMEQTRLWILLAGLALLVLAVLGGVIVALRPRKPKPKPCGCGRTRLGGL